MGRTHSWSEVLDSLSAQVDLQEHALLHGHHGPVDLEVYPPTAALEGNDRLRAIDLFERCEWLLDAATARAVGVRNLPASPYGRTP